jgi:Toprim-like
MIDVISFLPNKRKQTNSGWISFNAPCCVHRGDTQDRRQRGGIKSNERGWSYHCFNCGYTASFILGRNLGFKARKLLQWLNVPDEEIERINLESLKHKNIEGLLEERQQVANVIQGINFDEIDLPDDFIIADENTPQVWDYLKKRCVPLDYPYGLQGTPYDAKYLSRHGVVIPFTHDKKIVGYATRYLDDRTPKYINNIPHGYVFGTDLQQPDWQSVIVVEGVFDALSINGLAVLHADINDAQVRLIRSLGREVVVVPDQDEAGMKLVDRAVELGWAVSMPEWPAGVKDVNDAVIHMGRLATLLTIMQAKETSKIKIELRKKQLVKRLRA